MLKEKDLVWPNNNVCLQWCGYLERSALHFSSRNCGDKIRKCSKTRNNFLSLIDIYSQFIKQIFVNLLVAWHLQSVISLWQRRDKIMTYKLANEVFILSILYMCREMVSSTVWIIWLSAIIHSGVFQHSLTWHITKLSIVVIKTFQTNLMLCHINGNIPHKIRNGLATQGEIPTKVSSSGL